MPLPKPEYRDLQCKLSASELDKKRDELVATLIQQQEAEAEKKEVTSEFRDTIKDCKRKTRELSGQLKTKSEERQIKCEYRWDKAKKMVEFVRTDTKAVVSSRKPTQNEMQGTLGFKPPKKKKKGPRPVA